MEGLLLDLLILLSELEKAASSISLFERLLDPDPVLFKLSLFNLEDDCRGGLEELFILRLDVWPLAEGRVPRLLS